MAVGVYTANSNTCITANQSAGFCHRGTSVEASVWSQARSIQVHSYKWIQWYRPQSGDSSCWVLGYWCTLVWHRILPQVCTWQQRLVICTRPAVLSAQLEGLSLSMCTTVKVSCEGVCWWLVFMQLQWPELAAGAGPGSAWGRETDSTTWRSANVNTCGVKDGEICKGSRAAILAFDLVVKTVRIILRAGPLGAVVSPALWLILVTLAFLPFS